MIFEDVTSKSTTTLPDFEGKPTFDGVQILDEQRLSDKNTTSEEEKAKSRRPPQKPSKIRAGRDANRAPKKEIEPPPQTQV